MSNLLSDGEVLGALVTVALILIPYSAPFICDFFRKKSK